MVALVHAAIALGSYARIVVAMDKCNRHVFEAALQPYLSSSSIPVQLETFPATRPRETLSPVYEACLQALAESCDLVIAGEWVGLAADGHCYTMQGIDMMEAGLIAPLHCLVNLAWSLSLSSSNMSPTPFFIAIGDGGNELGMGKVLSNIINNLHIVNAS